MFHALYIVAFAVLSVLAVSNLIRNLIMLGSDTRQSPRRSFANNPGSNPAASVIPHPEMLDEQGRVMDEPLLVMRSISIDDAREKLDALYEGKVSSSDGESDED